VHFIGLSFLTEAHLDKDQPGYILLEHGYLPEPQAATAIGLSTPTLVGYRKSGIGPPYTIVGRRIWYSRDALAAWLANGGTRAAG
jgi:hypothetical protein